MCTVLFSTYIVVSGVCLGQFVRNGNGMNSWRERFCTLVHLLLVVDIPSKAHILGHVLNAYLTPNSRVLQIPVLLCPYCGKTKYYSCCIYVKHTILILPLCIYMYSIQYRNVYLHLLFLQNMLQRCCFCNQRIKDKVQPCSTCILVFIHLCAVESNVPSLYFCETWSKCHIIGCMHICYIFGSLLRAKGWVWLTVR